MKSVKPKFAFGQVVHYTDHHGRPQTGSVKRITAHWHPDGSAYVSYVVSHPTYRGKRFNGDEYDLWPAK